MKQSKALAYLRQLCCLGLGKEIVIPEFLRAVQTVIPSSSNVFTGVDEQLITQYVIFEFITTEVFELAPSILPVFFTPERRAHVAAWFRHHPVLTDMTLLDEKFYERDLYNLLWRPLDQHYGIVAPVIENGKPAGLLFLCRSRIQQPFNSREQTLCARLTPYIAHALRAHSDEDIPYSENGQSGMMIMNAEGAIVYLCDRAKSLLTLAGHPVLIMDGGFKEADLLPKLTQLCRNLNAIFRGKDAAPPSLYYTNPRGRFMFHAYWLNRQNKEPGALIGITIEYQEPKVLNILRSLQSLPLSSMQKEVALLMAQGYSSEKIGQRLHIKLTTVKDHISKIYVKLDIHQRDELMPKLLALDTSLRNPVSKASLDLCK